MPIIKIDGEAVTHRCGACGFEREVVLELVEIGIVPNADGRFDLHDGDRADPLVVLPPCNKCGSVEVLSLPSEGDEPIEQEGELVALWERLVGEPLDVSVDVHEPPVIDITTEDYQALF